MYCTRYIFRLECTLRPNLMVEIFIRKFNSMSLFMFLFTLLLEKNWTLSLNQSINLSLTTSWSTPLAHYFLFAVLPPPLLTTVRSFTVLTTLVDAPCSLLLQFLVDAPCSLPLGRRPF